MHPWDFAKAAGVALGVLVLNVVISIVVILFYSFFIDPGHPHEYYNAAALKIAPWCSHTAGTALFLGAGFWCGSRQPQRNGVLFAATVAILYALIDAATVGFVGILNMEFGLSMLAKFGAAQLGAYLALRKTRAATGTAP